MKNLSSAVSQLWQGRKNLSPGDAGALEVVDEAIGLLDRGEARVAEIDPSSDEVVVHEWLRQAILLLFVLSGLETVEHGPFEYTDRLPLKRGLQAAGVRALPGSSARRGAFLGRGVVLMPSYVNIGAYVGAATMVDTWATVGSCAQIGERVHLSGGVGIGGVLEPPNARPVVIEDDVLVGSRSMVIEGARVGEGSVLGAGTILNPSIPVIDAWSGDELGRGYVPPWSVAVNATRRKEYPGGEFFLPCVLVVRHLTPGERHDKAMLNGILREHGASA
ncbi:MAG: 2,3,4,5-tetrahydropyridine-2,6-dicarboxylate N-succinyltransferase [Acidimicrobiales bacterium]|jgi:2,3,4,5-tetrahydropyridine-2-carboxylate N-succinyltransferase